MAEKKPDSVQDEAIKSVVKRTRKDLSWNGNKNLVAGDNTRYLRHSLAFMDLPPIDISKSEQVEERIKWYFGHCAENDMKPTVMGMANALGVDRRTLYDWSRGNIRDSTHSPIIKRAYSVLEELWEDYMLNGKINPVSGIFIGKNHFDYTDKQEITIVPKNPLGDAENPEEIRQKYLAEETEESPK